MAGRGVSGFIMDWLTTLTVLGVVLGGVLGYFLQDLKSRGVLGEEDIDLITLPGALFINFFKCIVGPMIFAAMVGVSKELGSQLGGPVSKTVVTYYLTTTFIAATSGLVWFNVFSGVFQPLDPVAGNATGNTTDNGDGGVSSGDEDKLTLPSILVSFGNDIVQANLTKSFLEMNVIGLVFFGIFFGAVAGSVPGGDQVVNFFSTVNVILMAMIQVVLPTTPLGVGALIANTVARNSGNIAESLVSLGILVVVCLVGYAFHIGVFYSGVYLFMAKRNPLQVLMKLPRLWATSFGTSSSAASLKFTQMTCSELGYKQAVIDFVTPIGCTVNMDGSAIERTITVLWVGYVTGQDISIAQQIIVAILAVAMSIGGAPVPSSGVSTIVLMVEAAGINTKDPTVQKLIALRLGIEWLLDGFNTSVNVTGDVYGTGITDSQAPDFDEGDVEAEITKAAEPGEMRDVMSISTRIEMDRRSLQQISSLRSQQGDQSQGIQLRDKEALKVALKVPDVPL